jgi:hypothetical protein
MKTISAFLHCSKQTFTYTPDTPTSVSLETLKNCEQHVVSLHILRSNRSFPAVVDQYKLSSLLAVLAGAATSWHSLARQGNNHLDIADREEARASVYGALVPVLIDAGQQSDSVAFLELQLTGVLSVKVIQRITASLLATSCTVTSQCLHAN